ncbi:MAG: response regulator [Leptolyngbyaceae cyanobacterium MAG.088]|nr:response regulator [Leptolyngbyaceae cyanobacterium MAG.088]
MTKLVVICVDDELTVLKSLKAELKSTVGDSYLVEMAENGHEAIALTQELLKNAYEIPLIIADYLMPDLQGDDVLRQIHQLSPNTLKILLIGQTHPEAIVNTVRHINLYRYIVKPWQPEDLRLTVQEALNSYHRQKELLATQQELLRANQEQEYLIKELHEKQRNLKKFTDELFRINQALSQFVPQQFMQLLGQDSITDVQLGDQVERVMSILFADIRGFTSLSEQMAPADTFEFINSFFQLMEPAIRKNYGFIDKYIGDAIMALFSVSADDAVMAGLEMLQRLERYNQRRVLSGRKAIEIGIGINTGKLILGTVGGYQRMDSTVIGDAVNLAARIEECTKAYGVTLLVSEETLMCLKRTKNFARRLVDQVTLRGKSCSTQVYEIFESDDDELKAQKLATKDEFEAAIDHYHRHKFDLALKGFQYCLAQAPQDKVARVYTDRCKRIIEGNLRNWRLRQITS